MPRKKRLLWQIYLPFLALLILSTFLVSWAAGQTLKSLYFDNLVDNLRTRAFLVHEILDERLSDPADAGIQRICTALGEEIQTRITVILADGRVVGDSEENPDIMGNHGNRPEVRTAYEGGIGVSQRFSYTLNTPMLYVAVPHQTGGRITAVIRTAKPMNDLSAALHSVTNQIVWSALFVSIAAALIAYVLSVRIKKPISEMIAGLNQFGRGQLDHRLYITQSGEMRQLAEAMNHMAEQLHDRIRTITRQHNEIQSILSGMMEAMIAVNAEEQIIRFNQAASALFHIRPEDAKDKNLSEVVRNTRLVDFVRRALDSEQPLEEIIEVWEGQHTVQARGARLRDSDGDRIGALIVLNDITQLKRMERVRSDFVANVSHELKTPITSIKGFVETLKEGAIHEPGTADRFLEIVSKHTDRLDAIIEDLLKLSRLEDEGVSVELSESGICGIIRDAVAACRGRAEQKQILIDTDCDPNLTAQVNPPLLEEALVNLIDNAVKYSPEGSRIEIQARPDRDRAVLSVQDHGPGIPKKNIDRIFERFYRMDRARSRDTGGTGLGLSIVKHIVQAHQGVVTVDSEVGRGSRFTITLPRNPSPRTE